MSLVTHSSLPTLAARLAKVHVLVVDDDPKLLQLLRGLLAQLGFVHITALTSAQDALGVLKNKRPERQVDLLITDWNMSPVDGLELIRYIRTSPDSNNPYLPIIMLSGRGEWSDVEKARDAGFTEYLVKPFSAKALCDRIILCVETPREFVTTSGYKGPSRRRKDGPLPEGITEDRRKRSSVNPIPGKALKSKIGFDINMRQIFTPENVKNAQGYIDERADKFHSWVMDDIDELFELYKQAKKSPKPQDIYAEMGILAFSIKSHAGTFGYDLASQVAKSMLACCNRPLPNQEYQLLVLHKHIETLRTIFQNNIKGKGDQVGNDLLQSMDTLIQKCKKL